MTAIGAALILLGALGSAWITPGCTRATQGELDGSTAPLMQDGSYLLKQAHAGKNYKLPLGSELLIQLEGHPSTGYDWVLVSGDSPVLESRGEPLIKVLGPEENVEQPARYTFRFRAARQGQTELVFRYARPWEKDGDADVIRFVVRVSETAPTK